MHSRARSRVQVDPHSAVSGQSTGTGAKQRHFPASVGQVRDTLISNACLSLGSCHPLHLSTFRNIAGLTVQGKFQTRLCLRSSSQLTASVTSQAQMSLSGSGPPEDFQEVIKTDLGRCLHSVHPRWSRLPDVDVHPEDASLSLCPAPAPLHAPCTTSGSGSHPHSPVEGESPGGRT